ncbi:MAG: glycosyltransferase family 4 protein [Desulfovibrionales bacterium]|nr:glycosyltransferase family 4 protein [Desulfovibrionales bacterium]
MKVALVHYWLVGMRGGEKVLAALADLFPQAHIYTHVLDRLRLDPVLAERTIHTTFINSLPRAQRWYKNYLPFMPLALEELDLRDYDLVISSESGPAKGVLTRPDALHVCYCHSPMRYIWDLYPEYRQHAGRLRRLLFAPLAHYLRQWDVSSAARVDHFVANSAFVRQRIRKFYRREATVIYPPVNTGFWSAGTCEPGQYFLFVGELVPYKRADLAIAACTALQVPLVVVGDGPERSRLENMAGPQVRFMGRVPDDTLRTLMGSCSALLFPGVEDFGLVPVEAMSCGKPVIARAAGGALETVLPYKTGLFFSEPSIKAVVDAITEFQALETQFIKTDLQAHAEKFDTQAFNVSIRDFITQAQADL